jgi:hypothetical protein
MKIITLNPWRTNSEGVTLAVPAARGLVPVPSFLSAYELHAGALVAKIWIFPRQPGLSEPICFIDPAAPWEDVAASVRNLFNHETGKPCSPVPHNDRA